MPPFYLCVLYNATWILYDENQNQIAMNNTPERGRTSKTYLLLREMQRALTIVAARNHTGKVNIYTDSRPLLKALTIRECVVSDCANILAEIDATGLVESVEFRD